MSGRLLLAALVAGAALRFMWPGVLELKADERRFLAAAVSAQRGEPLPEFPTSLTVPNPPLAIWGYAAAARAFGFDTLQALSRLAAVTAMAALIGFTLLVRQWPAADRDRWQAALALAAVNPLAVLWHRKLWVIAILPIVLVMFWAGWSRRERAGGAAGAGAAAIVAAQLHLSAALLLLAAFLVDRIRDRRGRVMWMLIGAAAAGVPAVPWLYRVARDLPVALAGAWSLGESLTFKLWTLGLSEAAGLVMSHVLGPQARDYYREPLVHGYPTWAGLIATAASVAICALMMGRAVAQGGWRALRCSEAGPRTRDALAVGCVYLALFTISGLPIYRHYTAAIFPLTFLWLAAVQIDADRARARYWWIALVAAQAMQTVLLLQHLAAHAGAPLGEFGPI